MYGSLLMIKQVRYITTPYKSSCSCLDGYVHVIREKLVTIETKGTIISRMKREEDIILFYVHALPTITLKS